MASGRGAGLVAEADAPQDAVVDAADEALSREDDWTVVLGSAHRRRKMKGKEKRADAVRRSDRLAMKDTGDFVDVASKAVKLRELKDALKGCSAILQAHVGRSKVMRKITSPLSRQSVAALKAAAFGKCQKKVPGGADV
jgi:hypothetical protein